MNLANLGASMRAMRALRDKTLGDVAAAVTLAGVPLSVTTLGNIERGASPGPRIEVVWAVLNYLNITADLRWALICAVMDESDAVLP